MARGSQGVVMGFFPRETTNQSIQIVWIKFSDPKIGEAARSSYRYLYRQRGIPRDWTPIIRISRNISQAQADRSFHVTRKQFPLLPCAARTVHSVQGITADRLVNYKLKATAVQAFEEHLHGSIRKQKMEIEQDKDERMESKHIQLDFRMENFEKFGAGVCFARF